jgi:hypothetical protein
MIVLPTVGETTDISCAVAKQNAKADKIKR